MARLTLATQRLNNKSGAQVSLSDPQGDGTGQFQYRNTGVEVVLIRAGSGTAMVLTVPSVADTFGRTGDVTFSIGAAVGERIFQLGPFTPPQIWGDGASLGQFNVSGINGTSGIAVIAV
jgi:hypothetical protein